MLRVLVLKETRCNALRSEEVSIICDEKCEDAKEQEKKAQEEKEAVIKAEELRKQQVFKKSIIQFHRVY